jgi:hypothetical protein
MAKCSWEQGMIRLRQPFTLTNQAAEYNLNPKPKEERL